MSPPLMATLVAAVWVCLVQSGATRSWKAPWSGCDNGKLSLDRDLPRDAVWACPVPFWLESTTQSSPSIDTVYEPEAARQVCMDKTISYDLPIPSSGAYRPLGAESGEYLYCPPQRWLNNLHHGATVLLYHPCAPLSERIRLSILARSCLSDYIITPYPELEHAQFALVSWGRTLELSTVLTSEVCDWLEATAAEIKRDDEVPTRKYSLLLSRPAEQQSLHVIQALGTTSAGRCCEQSLFSHLDRGDEAPLHTRRQRRSRRQRRESFKQKGDGTETRTYQSSSASTIFNRTTGTILTASTEPFQKPQKQHVEHSAPAPGTGVPETGVTFRTMDLGKVSSSRRKGRPVDVVKHAGWNTAEEKAARGVKKTSGENDSDAGVQGGTRMKDDLLVDVKERELQKERPHVKIRPSLDAEAEMPSRVQGRGIPPPPLPALRQNPGTTACGGCGPDGRCDCGRDPARALDGAGVPHKGPARTPRSDEAVWAAAALGFLLVLLALSVLQTRLYRHWRSPPSLYWPHPQQDYDSVADVIRRRLRITERRHRRKSSQHRRLECVLPPSSDDDDDQ